MIVTPALGDAEELQGFPRGWTEPASSVSSRKGTRWKLVGNAVTTGVSRWIDFMTARWARLPYEFLEQVSLRIINEVDGISRVTYDISGKPPATIEWE